MISRGKKIHRKTVIIFSLFTSLLPMIGYAQERIWEFEKTQEREKKNAIKHDSIMNHIKNKIEISLGYGQFALTSKKLDGKNGTSVLPKRYNDWLLGLSWHPSERFVLDMNFDLRIEKEIIKKPEIISILNGEDFEIEGKGAGMIPMEIGCRFYFKESRFRPYIGLTGGFCIIKYQYTEIRGNLNDGIDRSDVKGSETLIITGITTGFDYRLGERINAGICIQYQHSNKFKNKNLDYTGVSGFKIAPQISVLLF